MQAQYFWGLAQLGPQEIGNKSLPVSYYTSPASHFVPLQAIPAGLLGRFAASALRIIYFHNMIPLGQRFDIHLLILLQFIG